jgi:NADH:ubiquinone oxidoreductase subunit B-like Fe-S oxidoreductase
MLDNLKIDLYLACCERKPEITLRVVMLKKIHHEKKNVEI